MESKPNHLTTYSATITLVSTFFGGASSIIANAYAVSQLGVFGFVLMLLLSMVLWNISANCLCISAEISQKHTFNHLSYAFIGGKSGSLFTRIFIAVGNWLVVVTNIQIFADFLPPILHILLNNTDSIFISRWFAVLIGLLLLSPWIIVQNISRLVNLSLILVIMSLIQIIILFINCILATHSNNISDSFEIFTFDISNIFIGVPSITWCWAIQFNVLPLYISLDPTNRLEQMQKVALYSGIIIFICYSFSGLSTYFVWGNQINQDFITNLDYNNMNYIFYLPKWVSITCQLIMCVSSFVSTPLYAIQARKNLHSVFMEIYRSWNGTNIIHGGNVGNAIQIENMQQENISLMRNGSGSGSDSPIDTNDITNSNDTQYGETLVSRIVEGTCLCFSAAIVALFVSDLNWMMALNGATYSVYIAFLLPPIFYYKVMKGNVQHMTKYHSVLNFLSKIIFVFGLLVLIMGIFNVIL